MAEIDYDVRTRNPDSPGPVRHAAGEAADAAGSAAGDVAETAKTQAQTVVTEAKSQAQNLASDVRGRVGTEARSQNDRLANGLRQFADELDEMVSERDESPARSVVTQVSQGGRRVADYLAERGPEGVLDELQDFARRKPGTFLAVAAAAGFVAGRLGKTAFSASKDKSGTGQQASSPDTSGAPYAAQPVYTEPSPVYTEPAPAHAAPTPVYTESAYGTGNPATAGGVSATVYTSTPADQADDYGSGRP